jgi:hypothetical protein
MTKFIIYTQVKEWYGDPDQAIGDPAHGRYKNKGGQEFIFEGIDGLYLQDRELIKKFNAKYDRVGRFMRYEAKEIDFYFVPEEATIVDGEIVIPFT